MQKRTSTSLRWLATWGPLIAGAGALVALAAEPPAPPLPLLAGFIALAIPASWIRLPLGQGGKLSLIGAVALPALLVLGPLPAAVVAAAAAVARDMLSKQPRDTLGFRAGQQVVAIVFAAAVCSTLTQRHLDIGAMPMWDELSHGKFFPGGLGCILAYALVMTLLATFRIAAGKRRPLSSILLVNAPWHVTGNVAIGTAGVMAALLAAGQLFVPSMMWLTLLQIASLGALLLQFQRQVGRESAYLHEALTDLLKTLNVDEILTRFGNWAHLLANPDAMWIALRAGNEPYRIAFARGVAPESVRRIAPTFSDGATGWVVAHLRPLRIADYERSPMKRASAEQGRGDERVRSILVVPLVVAHECLGVVTLIKQIPGDFTLHHERMITTLAAQASLTINNAQLYESTQRSVARTEALQQVARAAAASSDLAEIQQKILDLAVATMGAERGILALYDEHENTLTGVAFKSLAPELTATWRAPISDPTWRYHTHVQAFRTMEPVPIADRLELPGAPLALPPGRSRAMIAVPMTAQGRPVGTIGVGRTPPHRWTPEEIELLQAIASEGAVAMEHARLSKSTKEQLQRMKALETISERINSLNDLNTIFELIADSAREVLGADRCAIYLSGTGSGAAHILVRGIPDEWVRVAIASVEAGTGPSAMAMRLREPIIMTDVRTDPRAGAMQQTALAVGFATVAIFPLIYRGKVVGVLRLYHDATHRYTADEIALGAAFANQAAIAVQNARFLHETERRAHQLGLLNRLVTRLVTSLRPEDMFETLVEELHSTLGYRFVSFFHAQGGNLRLAASRGYEPGAIATETTVTTDVVGRAARTQQPVLIEDVAADPDYIVWNPAVTQAACVPVFQDDRFAGVIKVEVIESSLTKSDLDILIAVAGEVTSAMRNATLFSDLRQARDELQALYECAQALSSSLELSAVLEAMVAVTCRQFGYDRGAILLIDAAGDLVVHATNGDPAPAGRIPVGQGAEGRAAQDARPVLVADIARDPTRTDPSLTAGSTLAVPLLREGRVIGVFSVGTARPGALGERDQRILTTLAGYAAVAIENARLYEQARHLAVTDGLTGLLNHRAFRQTLEQELERSKRYAIPLSLIMIEIDKFKRYNDTYGHLRGDEVLRLVARVLEKEHRQQVDIVARYGGDEFMILLPHTAKEAAVDAAERIRHAVEVMPFIVGTAITSVTLSLGVASYPQDGDTTDALVDAVDSHMYVAKQAGGNAVAKAASS